ncbi:MAG: hypothetical protein LBH69_04800 [Methanomassiliicoccaceae archaeon]|jgi:predicted transcriptional regulator of viral defense system|nr:hypothetical protein [Methanomassiliicoccaceae archaeon]
MRTRMVTKEELADRLLRKFGTNEPIFTKEVIRSWKEYSRPRVFQLLKELLKDGVIARSEYGVYYFPTIMLTGKRSVLSGWKITNKKFIHHGEAIFGYYSGLTLLNGLHLTTQMPFDIELVTSKTSASVRRVKVSTSFVTVHRSRVPITKKNVYALMLLETFTEMRRPLNKKEAGYIREFVELKQIREEVVLRYAKHFPAHALENILRIGEKNVFA